MKESFLIADITPDSFVEAKKREGRTEILFNDWGSRSCTVTLLTSDEVEKLCELLVDAYLTAEEIKDAEMYEMTEQRRKEYIRDREKIISEKKKELYNLIDMVIERYLK